MIEPYRRRGRIGQWRRRRRRRPRRQDLVQSEHVGAAALVSLHGVQEAPNGRLGHADLLQVLDLDVVEMDDPRQLELVAQLGPEDLELRFLENLAQLVDPGRLAHLSNLSVSVYSDLQW